jgi:hypothetical protein
MVLVDGGVVLNAYAGWHVMRSPPLEKTSGLHVTLAPDAL